MSIKRLLAAAGAAALAVNLWWRRNPSACPFAMRFVVDLPRPGLRPKGLLDVLRPQVGQRILEIGPGTGHFTLPVARAVGPDGRVDALDLQQEMLDELGRRATREGVANVVPRQGDARSLPYEDASFDAVFLVTVLGEIPDQDAALREIGRVLKPGGRLVSGEIALDPHLVTAGALRRRGEAAGLTFVRRAGTPLAFFAELRRPG
jgi:ubiquinone/menaquinone biosynthesis C-methylase UbiE